jgi:hypothetical protein
MQIKIINCEEVDEKELESLRSKPHQKLEDVLRAYGMPCQNADSAEGFLAKVITDHVEWVLDMIEDWSDEEARSVLETGALAKEIGQITTVYTRITYPLSRPALFRFDLELNNKTLTAGHLLWIYTIAYHNVYDMEEKESGDPGRITGMFNRAKSNGPFGIWGHDISDLIYNGSSIIEVYDTQVFCEFECDS